VAELEYGNNTYFLSGANSDPFETEFEAETMAQFNIPKTKD